MGQPPFRGPVERTGWRALWLGCGALLTTVFFYPLGVVLGIASLVVGIRARRSARQAHGLAPGATAGMVLGSIGLVLSTILVGMSAYLWPERNGYQECLKASNTGIDRQACRDKYYPKIEKKLDLPAGSMDKYGNLF